MSNEISKDEKRALREYGLSERLDQAKRANCSNAKCEYCEYEQDARQEEIADLERQLEQSKLTESGG